MSDFVDVRSNAIIELIKSYHDYESGDGDSVVYLKYDNYLKFLKEKILEKLCPIYGWEILVEQNDYIVFGKINELCIITTNKEIFDNQPMWIGLKIEV